MSLSAAVAHLALLRGTEPLARNPIRTLLALFTAVFVIGAVLWLKAHRPFWPLALAAQAYFACALVYILTYLGLLEDSPSVTLVRFVDLAGAAGRREEELLGLLRDEDILQPRLRSMSDQGLIVLRGGRWFATDKGRRFEACFGLWARLFRVGRGG